MTCCMRGCKQGIGHDRTLGVIAAVPRPPGGQFLGLVGPGWELHLVWDRMECSMRVL
jgi:hypothetical protein